MKRATKTVKRIRCKAVISIHALVKRATKDIKATQDALDISIHALVKRATLYIERYVSISAVAFQSTPS